MKITVTCPSCSKVIQLDAAKIPAKPVTFGCPTCKGKVPIDGSKIPRGEPAAKSPAPAVPSAPPATPLTPLTPVTPVTPAPVRSQAPQSQAAPQSREVHQSDDADDEFDLIDHFEIPADTTLPSGLVISEDDAIAHLLQEVLKPFGSVLRQCSGAKEAMAISAINLPMLIVYVAKTLTPPPFAPMAPLFSLDSAARRRTFFLVLADNVKTLDGNSAFFHGFDLLVAKSDVAKAERVLYSALEFKRNLSGPFLDGMLEVEGG